MMDKVQVYQQIGYYLPKYCTLRFINQFEDLQKNVFKQNEIRKVPEKVPQFQELSVKNLWNEVKKDEHVRSYFPDYPKGMLPDADYFYSVINTIFDKKIEKLVFEAYQRRNLQQPSFKKASPEFLQKLQDVIIKLKNTYKIRKYSKRKTIQRQKIL